MKISYTPVVGSRVNNLHVGDRVALEPGPACRVCHLCKSGKYQVSSFVHYLATETWAHRHQLCGNMKFADHPRDGTLQRYFKIRSDLAYKIPNTLSLEDGALVSRIGRRGNRVLKSEQHRSSLYLAPFMPFIMPRRCALVRMSSFSDADLSDF